MSGHRDPFTFRETDSEIATLRTRVEEQAEAKLARVVWVLNKHASDAVRNLCPDIANAICQTVDAALVAAREQPTQEKRLRPAALDLVAEYRSHGGKGTHQECMPGCGCMLSAKVDALATALVESKT